MLETTLSILKKKIASTLYCKPTDTHSYLHYNSSDSQSCENARPYSQCLRIRIICSTDAEFERNATMTSELFRRHGYPKRIITRSVALVRKKQRHSILYPLEAGNKKLERIALHITYIKNNLQVCKIVKTNFDILSTD